MRRPPQKEPPPKARDKIIYKSNSLEIVEKTKTLENASPAVAYEGVVRTTKGPWEKDLKSNWVQENVSDWTLCHGVERKKKEQYTQRPMYWGPPPKVPQEPKKVKRSTESGQG